MPAHVAVAETLVGKLKDAILDPLITLALALAVLVFLYGIFEYVRGAESEGARDLGRKHMIWGIVGLLVMVSAVAIMNIFLSTFGIDPI